MIDGTFHVHRWTKDKRPFIPGIWSCSLELVNDGGRVFFGLDLPYREVARLDALIAKGPVRLSDIFGPDPSQADTI